MRGLRALFGPPALSASVVARWAEAAASFAPLIEDAARWRVVRAGMVALEYARVPGWVMECPYATHRMGWVPWVATPSLSVFSGVGWRATPVERRRGPTTPLGTKLLRLGGRCLGSWWLMRPMGRGSLVFWSPGSWGIPGQSWWWSPVAESVGEHRA